MTHNDRGNKETVWEGGIRGLDLSHRMQLSKANVLIETGNGFVTGYGIPEHLKA